jgi:RND superfamily putative drug exporter
MLTGMSAEDSVALAAGTAGSSVVFAAATVIVALASLSIVGIPFLTVMGLTASAAVLIALLIALTLVPAMLGFAGDKVVTFLRIAGLRSRLERTARRSALEPERTFGASWARFVVRRKYLLIVGGVATLLVLAIPALSLQLGLPSGANSPASSTAHKAFDLTTRHFGIGSNGPLTVVVDTSHATSPDAATTIATSLSHEPNVAFATVGVSENHTTLIQVTPKTGPNDSKTTTLVKRIRRDSTGLQSQTGTTILVGGVTAQNIDTSQKVSNALPTFLVLVVLLAFVLLTLAFRTLLVPLKSVLGFLLSVLAAFGAEVAVFQWGWLKNALNIQTGQTLSFLPIILLAVIFGLSSDYEVFVASRIKEEFTRTGDAEGSVARGAAQSARVVTTAALIMFSVFVCFLLFNTNSTIKAIGFTLAVGVFLDAFIVRLILVPAIMAAIGHRFWYHPQWFARTVPDLDIEGEKLAHLMAQRDTQPELVAANADV